MKTHFFAIARFVSCAAALLAASACSVGPKYQRPEMAVPASWSEAQANEIQAQNADLSHWWDRFEDPALSTLVADGLQGNLDLAQAASRIREARALLTISGAEQYPQIDANAAGIRGRASKNNAVGPPNPVVSSQWQAGFDAIWELDFFGRVSHEVEAAQAGLESAIEDERDIRVTLAGEIARSYFELRGAQQRLRIDHDSLVVQQETVTLLQAKVSAGVSDEFDLTRAQAQAAATAARAPQEEALVSRNMHRLAVLLGHTPQELDSRFGKELREIKPLSTVSSGIEIGVPTDLLRRRPDIRRAEREIAQTTALIGVATADLFPRFSLVGSVGLQASSFHGLNNTGSGFWSMGPTMSLPIFNAGRLRAQVKVQEEQYAQALSRYEQRVLAAIQETEDALVSLTQEKLRRKSLVEAVAASTRAANLARELYGKGLTDFLSVITAERARLDSESELASSDQTLATSMTSLFKALGGGWENTESS